MRRGAVDTMVLFERSASNAASLVGQVRAEQRHSPTPCGEWDVEALLVHMVGGTGYLMNALGIDRGPVGTDEASYRAAIARCVEAAGEPGALARRCMSPIGFEWSIGEAAAGTAMDQLVHTWDLAVAIGADRRLDPELVNACVEMFVPVMPDIGRQAGIVGPEVRVAAQSSP